MLLAVRELVVTQPEPTAASTKAEALHFEVLVEGLTMKPGVPAADGKVGLTRFRGHLNRFDYGSEQEVFNGQETTGV
jgi:hypothetical protein